MKDAQNSNTSTDSLKSLNATPLPSQSDMDETEKLVKERLEEYLRNPEEALSLEKVLQDLKHKYGF